MLETKRLILKPLSYYQLLKYVRLDNSLETELNLTTTSRTISDDLKEALEKTILPNVADLDKNYLFSTIWTIISKADKKMVGDLCFMGEPDENGTVEIGYGTYEEFRKKGFMTEAVCGMIKWAEKQPNIRFIIASTDKTNIDSFSILERNNFIKSGESESLYNWTLRLIRD
jgi:[ribosomal protein S5]-alanine N-acetyltransferase